MSERESSRREAASSEAGSREAGSREAAGFERHWLEQVRRGLELTPAQRLAWLETTVRGLADWVGRARLGKPNAR